MKNLKKQKYSNKTKNNLIKNEKPNKIEYSNKIKISYSPENKVFK